MPTYITRDQAAQLAGVELRTIDRWAERGDLHRYRVKGRTSVRYRREDVLKLITPAPAQR